MACESVLPYLRDWLMPPAAVPAGYARRVHIAFDYRAYRARCGRPTVRHADAQAREIAAHVAEKYGLALENGQICQLSGEILLHQLIYPLPGLGRASAVIDLDICVDAQRCGVVRDGRGPIDLCARALYRAAHMGRHTP